MTKGETLCSETVLCALYLKGAPRPQPRVRRRWPTVLDTLKRDTPTLGQAEESLRAAGLYEEASLLGDQTLVDWSLEQVDSGRTLTAASFHYPRAWLESLGAAAPPALWCRGRFPTGQFAGVVGSRWPTHAELGFVHKATHTALSLGLSVVSGGAVGVDRAAAAVVDGLADPGRHVVLLPFGVGGVEGEHCYVSVCEPSAGFSAAQAMERNTLIYALATHTAAVGPRFKSGGTWHGAKEALRKSLGVVGVYGGEPRAVRSLIGLGATDLSSLSLADFFGSAPVLAQPELFGNLAVKSPGLAYNAR